MRLPDRIVTSGAKRVAAQDASDAEGYPPAGAVEPYGLQGIFGTGRIETAGQGEEHRKEHLIKTDGKND